MASGDNHEYLHLSDLCEGKNFKVVFVIEYIPETRAQIIFLDRSRSLLRKAYSSLWTLRQERIRRMAFRKADGLQANGYPARDHYKILISNTIMYLDNRMNDKCLQLTKK